MFGTMKLSGRLPAPTHVPVQTMDIQLGSMIQARSEGRVCKLGARSGSIRYTQLECPTFLALTGVQLHASLVQYPKFWASVIYRRLVYFVPSVPVSDSHTRSTNRTFY